MPVRTLCWSPRAAGTWSLRVAAVLLVCGGSAHAQVDPAFAAWRVEFGLDAFQLPGGDADSDGLSNLQEFEAGTHPRGFYRRFFAEGAATTFFETRIALLNPSASEVIALLRFETGDGRTIRHRLTVPARSRRTLEANHVPGLTPAEFATTVEADGPLVADRYMKWRDGDGSHAETSAASPSRTWYLAEGATHSGFDLFYLLQNANDVAARVEVRYLLPGGASAIVKPYVVAPHSRFNIWVDTEGPELASTDVSAVISSDHPILVERAMYLTNGGALFAAGHESAAIPAPASRWFLAEGATGSYFDLFVLIANPNTDAAQVTATFLLPSGETVSKDYTVAPESRFNIWVDEERFPDASGQRLLADTAVSTIVTSTNGVPVVVERAMWWPGPTSASWHETHNSAGATMAATRWGLAEGEVGGVGGTETYILIANTSAQAGAARVTLFFEGGGEPSTKIVALRADSRVNVAVALEFPEATGKRFGALVESIGDAPVPIVVEQALYSTASGVPWAAGADAMASPLAGPSSVDTQSAASGTFVTVSGSGFSSQSRVAVGGVAAQVTSVSASELRIIVPFDSVEGQVVALSAGTSFIQVDDAVLPLTIVDLPPNVSPPGVLLRTVLERQLSAWQAVAGPLVAAMGSNRPQTSTPAAVEIFDATAAAIPALTVLLEHFLASLPERLDADELDRLERVLVANDDALSALAGANDARMGARAPGPQAAASTMEGDAFLAERAVHAQVSNNLGNLALIFTAASKLPAAKAADALTGLASLIADLAIGMVHGSVNKINVEAAHDPIPVSGSTAAASIQVERSIAGPSIATILAQPFKLKEALAEVRRLQQTPSLPGKIVSALLETETVISIIDRYYLTLDAIGIPLGAVRTLPVSLSRLETTVRFLKLAFDQSGRIDWHHLPRRRSEEAEFRLLRTLRTTAEARVVSERFFRVEQPRGRFFILPVAALSFQVQGTRPAPPQLVKLMPDIDAEPSTTWTAIADQPWIQVAAGGTFQPTGSPLGGTDVPVGVDASRLAPGRHTGSISFTADLDGSPQHIDITLDVTGPQTVRAQPGAAQHYLTNGCGGAEERPFTFSGVFYLFPEMPLIRQDGQWLPTTIVARTTASPGIGESTLVSTLSSDGIVSSTESGSAAGATVTGTMTFNLNTGEFVWCRSIVNPRFPPDNQNRRAKFTVTYDAVTPGTVRVDQVQVSSTTVAAGGIVTVSDVVTNTSSNGVLLTPVVRYVLDPTPARSSTSMPLVGQRTSATLLAGRSHAGSLAVTVPVVTPPGTYFVIACVDDPRVMPIGNCGASVATIDVR